MNERNKQIRSSLLKRYYKTAQLGWFSPTSMHWAKIVTQDKEWRWLRADQGASGYIKRNPPLHIYQTLLRFQGTTPPRGYESEGYLLGGPILFEMDASTKGEPCNLWTLIDLIYSIEELRGILTDYGQYRITRVMFSGFRGVHVTIKSNEIQSNPIRFPLDKKNRNLLRDLIKERKQLARSIGKWCSGWDWRVSEDIWRVARVPWSIHGKSSLRAITLQPPYTSNNMQSQLRHVSPFSFKRKMNIRISRPVPLFTFVDGELYGPYRKGWRAKLPLAVAVHLIWLDLARPREEGPTQAGKWFERGWQTLFRKNSSKMYMKQTQVGG